MKLKVMISAVMFPLAALYGFQITSAVLASYKPVIAVEQSAGNTMLTWSPGPYLSYYEIEALSRPPQTAQSPACGPTRIAKYRTWSTNWKVQGSFPEQTYWRVSAQSLLGTTLGKYSEPLRLDSLSDNSSQRERRKPQATSLYSHARPAPAYPVLTWTTVAGAVCYELELLSHLPENPNDIAPSRYQIFSTREIFVTGYMGDLSRFGDSTLFWRVRALDYFGNPIGVFSDATEITVNAAWRPALKPTTTAELNQQGTAPLLYPVYSWIPLADARTYEVELLSDPPENLNGTEPSRYRLWSKQVNGFACYDELPRLTPGTLFWRVRALDSKGQPVGVYSDAASFTVNWDKGHYAATFGDSITHGGGAVSYSPADWQYSYQTYLQFPVVNLGRSGDTAATMADRFEEDVLPVKPRFLLIFGGTNSLRGGTPAADVIRDLQEISARCIANGIRPIFLTLPPINPAAIERVFQEKTIPNWQEEFAAVNRFIKQQRYHIDVEPHFQTTNGILSDYYAVDGLHIDIEGKKLIAQVINANWGRVTR